MLGLVLLLGAAATAAGSSLPSGAISLPLVRKSDYSSYLAKLEVGTPLQTEYLKVDTGSATFSLENPKNNVCSLKSKPCAKYGTFANTSSSTSKWIDNLFSDGLHDFGRGSTLQDVLQIGDTNVGPVQFGYIDAYDYGITSVPVPAATILGLALLCEQFNSSCYKSGYYLIPQLYDNKKINRRCVSIYLGPEEPAVHNSQIIIGGAYDKAKQASTPFTVPMVSANRETNSVNTSAISSTIGGKVTRIELSPQNISLVDTGNKLLYIPPPFWSQVMKSFGNPNETNQRPQGGIYVDCKYRSIAHTEKLSYEFGSTKNKIDVPLSQLVIDFNNGTCGADITKGTPISYGIGALGAPFIRQTYISYDFEDFTVTMSQAKFTSAQNIVAVGK